MCHGSKNTIDANTQRMYVDSRDTIKVKNIVLVNNFEKVNFPSSASAITDLIVMNQEAKSR